MKSFLAHVVILTCLFSTTNCNNHRKGWKTIEFEEYLLDVPEKFNLKPLQGIDSKFAQISGDDIMLNANAGYFTDTLYMTPEEFLRKHWFTYDAASQFMKQGVTYDNRNFPKIEVLSIRPSTSKDSDKVGFFSGSDYIARCRHNKVIFDYPVRLPSETKSHNITIRSTNNLYTRFVTPKIGNKGTTGIYMREISSLNKSRNSYYAIVIAGENLQPKQKALVLEIFKTLRPKPQKED